MTVSTGGGGANTVLDRPSTDISLPRYRWWVGWRPLVTMLIVFYIGFAVGNAVAIHGPVGDAGGEGVVMMTVFSGTGLLAGVGLWYWGVLSVNRWYRQVLDVFVDQTAQEASNDLPFDQVERRDVLVSGRGSKPLIAAEKTYYVSHLVFGPRSVLVARYTFDMVDRDLSGYGRVEFDYDALESVSYDAAGNILELHGAGGETVHCGADDEPVTVLETVTNRTSGDVVRVDPQ